jgi:hypothetical protein
MTTTFNQSGLFTQYWTLSHHINTDGSDNLCPKCGAVTRMLVEEDAGSGKKKIIREICADDWDCMWENPEIGREEEDEQIFQGAIFEGKIAMVSEILQSEREARGQADDQEETI